MFSIIVYLSLDVSGLIFVRTNCNYHCSKAFVLMVTTLFNHCFSDETTSTFDSVAYTTSLENASLQEYCRLVSYFYSLKFCYSLKF